MSEYGIKIKNFQAGSIYEYMIGVRDKYDFTEAMLTNSLFSEFIVANGLKVWKQESTRDIICIEFDYGSRSFENEMKHISKIARQAKTDYRRAVSSNKQIMIDEAARKKDKIHKLYWATKELEEKFDKKTARDIRTLFYVNGVDIEYKTFNKKGEVIKTEVIHYKMLYRTPGKAKKGSCMFINEKLYDVAHDFLCMGIKLPFKNSPIIEMGAYSSLITSTIVGKVRIDPKNILVLKDVDSYFTTNVISVETNEDRHCMAVPRENYSMKNTLFDGQALIDSSIFPEWGDGYILLRHHLCKMAAFNTDIHKFFREYFGCNYETAEITDMFGIPHKVKDIKLITTDNAMKWLKFGVSYEYWAEKVSENDCMFGIVKTAHQSKLGNVQRMSYQMINALSLEIMEKVTAKSVSYIERLKTDDAFFLDYLKANSNFSNDFDVLIALCNQNPDFVRSSYFRERKYKIIEAYVLNFKSGKVIQDADNLVIVGSPYAMLLHAVGEDPLKDPTFAQEDEAIQCWTARFADGEFLAEFRSPFNSRNNLGYLHNVYHEYFDKYFNFGKLIVAVNMVGTSFQNRNNGFRNWVSSTEM